MDYGQYTPSLGTSRHWSVRQGDLPLLPQSAQDSSSSGRLSRFDSFVPRQKLHIGMGSTRSWVGTQTETNCLKTDTGKGCTRSTRKPVCFRTFYPAGISEITADILLVKAGWQTQCVFWWNSQKNMEQKLKEWGEKKREFTSHRLEMNNKWSSSSEICRVWDPPHLSITSKWVSDLGNHSLRA